MLNTLTEIKERISPRAFLQGLAVVALVYGGIFAFILLKSDTTLKNMQDRLIAQTILIEREQIPAPVDTTTYIPSEKFGPEIQQAEIQIEAVKEIEPIETALPLEPAEHTQTEIISGGALRSAPMEGLYEETQNGPLPIISADGLSPFMAYKKPFSLTGKPLIAVVVLDFGLSALLSDQLIAQLPPEISLILSPYAADAEQWQKKARDNGHETWLQLPLENRKFISNDPGPQALLAQASIKYNQDRLGWILSRAPGYAGVAGETDEIFDHASNTLSGVFKNIFSRGLGYLEMNPQAGPAIEEISLGNKSPYARSDLFIEDVSLKAIEKQASDRGYVIGIIRPTPNNIKALTTWFNTLDAKGYTLAPVSAIAEAVAAGNADHE